MSGSARIRREWTHRRLGLGATPPAEGGLARTEALLTAVGARRTSSSGDYTDAFVIALFDFVCDLDVVANIAEADAAPIPHTTLRASRSPRTSKSRRPSWRVLIPLTSSGIAACGVALTLLVAGGPPTTGTPSLSATAESRQLLSHADLLLTAATAAGPSERTELVAQAKADLTHVSRLLPLAPPRERPAIRAQMQLLDDRARPLASPPPPERTAPNGETSQPTAGGDGSGAGTPPGGGARTEPGSTPGGENPAPAHLRVPPQRDQSSGPSSESSPPPNRDGQSTGQPAATKSAPSQGSGPGGSIPPSGTQTQGTQTQGTQAQGAQPGSDSQPPPNGAPPPPR